MIIEKDGGKNRIQIKTYIRTNENKTKPQKSSGFFFMWAAKIFEHP